jgi:hypothetical protein
VFPLGYALALEQEIPVAGLLILQQTGHELPRAVWYGYRPGGTYPSSPELKRASALFTIRLDRWLPPTSWKRTRDSKKWL